jgi:5-methylcytosine-specific restriction endonuclease McrA
MEQRHCAVCGVGLEPQRRGRPRKYCESCSPSREPFDRREEQRSQSRAAKLAAPRVPCVECGQPVAPKIGGGLPKRYCGDPCRLSAKAKRRAGRPRPSTTVACVVCGKDFRKRKSEIARWAKHCCSQECKNLSKRTVHSCDLLWFSCIRCRASWSAHSGTESRCRRCRIPVSRSGPICRLGRGGRTPMRQAARLFISGTCEQCGEGFLARGGYHPETYRHCPGCKPRRWKKDRERAERAGVSYEPINRRLIFERDEYRCGICGELTDRTAEPSTPRFPTLDHIVPIANGGGHVKSNVQCACFECNWRKADGTDQAPRHPHIGGGRGLDPAPRALTLRPREISLSTSETRRAAQVAR